MSIKRVFGLYGDPICETYTCDRCGYAQLRTTIFSDDPPDGWAEMFVRRTAAGSLIKRLPGNLHDQYHLCVKCVADFSDRGGNLW
jgi:hypothetical protein